jgi:hypothetical protein
MWLLCTQADASPLAEPFIHPAFAALSVAEIEHARKPAGLPLPEPAQ